jgi:Holliday junction resolvase RusA-like endonuclease
LYKVGFQIRSRGEVLAGKGGGGMKLIIQGRLPTLNEIIDSAKRSRYVYAKMKIDGDELVAWSALSQKLPKSIKADYEITWICKDQTFDKDNIMAGQKFIFDGLRLAGNIKNDGWKQIGDVTHRFRVDKLNPRIEITITEVAG